MVVHTEHVVLLQPVHLLQLTVQRQSPAAVSQIGGFGNDPRPRALPEGTPPVYCDILFFALLLVHKRRKIRVEC